MVVYLFVQQTTSFEQPIKLEVLHERVASSIVAGLWSHLDEAFVLVDCCYRFPRSTQRSATPSSTGCTKQSQIE
jgi:hypothetical protein